MKSVRQILGFAVAATWLGVFSPESQARLDWAVPMSGVAPALAVDAAGNVYAAQRVFNGTNDDIVTAKFDSSGSLVWSNVFDSSEDDLPVSIALDASGSPVVLGAASNRQSVVTSDALDHAPS